MSDIALYNTLRRIPGITDAEAKEAVADIASSKEVATKSDIAELKAETKVDIKDMATKADIAELKAETKADIAEIKADIAEIKTELKYMRWLIVIVVSVAVGLIKYLP